MSLWRLDYKRLGLLDSLPPRLVFPSCLLALKRLAAMLQTSCPWGLPTWPQNKQLMGNWGPQLKSLQRSESCQPHTSVLRHGCFPTQASRRLPLVRSDVSLQGCRHQVPLAAWLQQQEFIFLHFWRLDIWNQGVGRSVSSAASLCRLQMAPSPCVLTWSFLCPRTCVSKCPLLIRMSVRLE